MAETERRNRIEKLRTAMWTDRSSFDDHWRDLGDFLLPRRTRFWPGDRNKGDKRNQNIIDSTGRFAARTLASGLHAGLTSPARPWMKLTTPDPELAEYGPVKDWLHVVTERMLAIFLETNLYNALPIIYGDLGVFGTGAMAVMDDTRDLFRAFTYPIGSYVLGLDARGVACTFMREYELTVRQTVETFGRVKGTTDIDWTNVSATIKNQWDRGDYESPVSIVWAVLPNDQPDPRRFEAKFMPWLSVHFERGLEGTLGNATGFLRESGFRTFPILAPRWDVTSPEDCYGTDCPGMTALGDIKQLQIMQRRKGQAIEKQVNPPMQGPSSLRTQKTSILAGDITFVDVREGMQGLRAAHEIHLDLADLTADLRETQYRIQRAFYEDLFLMLAQQDQARGTVEPMTAREVDERHEEKLLALGPVLERTNDELLDPLVDRTYMLMEAAGMVPDPPDELQGLKLKVEYISILAQAQRLVGIVGEDRFVQSTTGLMEAYPEIRRMIDIRRVVKDYADMTGVDPRTVRSDEEIDALLEQDARQQQAIQAAETAKNLGQAAHAAGTTPMGTGSALDQLVQAGATQGAGQ